MNKYNKKTSSKILKLLFKKAFEKLSFEFKDVIKIYQKKFRFSITFKITTKYAFMFTHMLFFLSFFIVLSFVFYLGYNVENSLRNNFNIISLSLSDKDEVPTIYFDELLKINGTNFTIFDENKKVLYTNEKNENLLIFYEKRNSSDLIKFNKGFMFLNSPTTSNPSNFVFSLNDKLNFNGSNAYIQITNNLSVEYRSVVILILILLVLNIMFILSSISKGSKCSKKMMLPVETMTKTVKNITINELHTRLDISGSQDELKDLAETFNNMLDRIENSYEMQNQFVSDASHELRTPISVVQGYANLLSRWGKNDEAILEESILAIKSEAESMKNLIEKLLFLARSDKNTQRVEKIDFYINELIDEVIKETKLIDETHEILNEQNGVFTINADRTLIKEALRIFVDNSLKYTNKGGKVKINCSLQKNQAVITIEDNGIGISKEALPHIFDRFYRADKSRTKDTGGTGLGLSIAKWIILKHNGNIEVKSKVNEGTSIILFLPLG